MHTYVAYFQILKNMQHTPVAHFLFFQNVQQCPVQNLVYIFCSKSLNRLTKKYFWLLPKTPADLGRKVCEVTYFESTMEFSV